MAKIDVNGTPRDVQVRVETNVLASELSRLAARPAVEIVPVRTLPLEHVTLGKA